MTIRVGVTTPSGWNGVGRLEIAPGHLACIPGNLTGLFAISGALAVRGRRVDLYVTRLPPWFLGASIPFRGEAGDLLVVYVYPLTRRKVRRALDEAGFDVAEHFTWIYRGFRWAEMRESLRRS